MRLQTESRRTSTNLTLDLTRPPHASLSGPPSSRRTSFAPLTGSSVGGIGHRRIASVSDSGLLAGNADSTSWPPSPGFHTPPSPGATPTDRQYGSSGHNRRVSLLFGRAPSPAGAAAEAQVQELRKEIVALRQLLEDTKQELVESQEAQEASDTCVKALRTFISENNVGISISTDVPRTPHPPPATATRSLTDEKRDSPIARWGFRLWNTSSDTDTAKATSPLTPVMASSHARQSSSASTASATLPPPVTRKFGSLFGTRASISSTSSTFSRPAVDSIPQEPPFHGSDTSSIAESSAEPLSPASDDHGIVHIGGITDGHSSKHEVIVTL